MAKAKYIDSERIPENQRSRNWCLVLYPDDPSHASAIEKLQKGYQYVFILHDQCESDDGGLKKPHYHVVLKFGNARWRTVVAEELGIEHNYLQICRSLKGAYCYLVHDGLPKAHQYSHDLVKGPLYNDFIKALEHERTQDDKVLTILHLIDSHPGVLNERILLERCCEAGLCGDLLRLGGLISKLIEIHNNIYFEPLPF